MAAALKKVRPSDALVIPAATFNTFIDAARDYQDRRHNAARDGVPDWRQTGIVLVRNETGADRGRFDVLGIAGPILAPGDADETERFQERVALRGIVPQETHRGRFVVVLEPLVNGAIGRACVDGACLVRVQMADESHTFAEVKPEETARLESAAAGSAGLLWVQPVAQRDDPTVAWTVARIGLPSSAATVRRALVTDYTADGLHYLGKLVDSHGAPLLDDEGHERPAVQLWCWKYPAENHPIADYFPAVRGGRFVPVYEVTVFNELSGQDETRVYVDGLFNLTCAPDDGGWTA